ncbi:phosphoesterase [candidate division KSB1 bacterium]|nr:DHH family phosphoesterase [candidate division KSB1 bacterium]RQW00045.1 MAG: phosphoesterase [candidate division KSB1 bacterium]
MKKISQSPNKIKKVLNALEGQLCGGTSLLIVMHDNPDPDAIASGLALKTLAESYFGVQATLAHGGLLGRAENRTMASLLNIELTDIKHIDFQHYDRIALVDTFPGRGNVSLPEHIHIHIVFDHHASTNGAEADLVVYNSKVGATATLLCELLIEAQVDLKVDLATAIAYAIRSETQELRREANKRDVQAYLMVYPQSSFTKIGAIAHPILSDVYFRELAVALSRACRFRHLMYVPLGYVESPEIIAEMADFFLRRERISWALAVGNYQTSMYLSLRTNKKDGRAFRVIQKIVQNTINAGGHDQFAGGRIDPEDASAENMMLLEEQIRDRFAVILGIKKANWRPLLENF